MDKKYWNDYYRKHDKDTSISTHSSFSEFCLSKFFIENNLNIVELGCGNGRDAIYFAHHRHNVVAIDQSTSAINIAKESLKGEVAQYLQPKELNFVIEDYFSVVHQGFVNQDVNVFIENFFCWYCSDLR